jgi:hypothetical protein
MDPKPPFCCDFAAFAPGGGFEPCIGIFDTFLLISFDNGLVFIIPDTQVVRVDLSQLLKLSFGPFPHGIEEGLSDLTSFSSLPRRVTDPKYI